MKVYLLRGSQQGAKWRCLSCIVQSGMLTLMQGEPGGGV